MSSLIQLRRRDTSTPWGFRMNGGSEYGSPLYIQKVTVHSLAQKSGLEPGDGLLQIGTCPTRGLSHQQAKMEIIRAGNELDFIVQRNAVPVGNQDGGVHVSRAEVVDEESTWKGIPAQDPNVQSRSFKMLQHQLATGE